MRWAPTDSGPHRPPTAATGAPSPSSSAAALHRVLFHTSAAAAGGAQREHHFDTLACVRRLQDEGFSEAQAAAVMRVLSSVLDEAMQKLRATLVARDAHERAAYTQQVDFGKLRSELVAADSSEASLTRASHERLTNDLAKLNARLRDDIGRTQASVRLDFNLEKGRIREEANVQDLRIQETQARIEQEAAGLRERVEGVKFSTLQWLMCVAASFPWAFLASAWRGAHPASRGFGRVYGYGGALAGCVAAVDVT
ncbi:MAG: Coiled-coil domain-containing protein 90B, mitochondrial [Phylliscum demangeonii]|nr:MAG: Coiled-coil domain-containing protein 90B, mitochondrial [Phylliscum demangeonii]